MRAMVDHTEPQLSDADTNDLHDVMFASQDYLRRIHWWVRLFGIVWVVVPAVAAVLGCVFLIVAAIVGRAA